jgi:2'-hydroxyisoflavone reductase
VEELLGDRNGDLKALEGRDWDVCIDNPTSLRHAGFYKRLKQ